MRRLSVAIAAILAISTGLWQLRDASTGLVVTRERVGPNPVTIFRPASGAPAPVVVIAHGFAGSQQLMQPFAITLARNGYVALTFDFPGHGQNPALLPGGLAEASSPTQALLQSLDAVAAFGRKLPSSDGRLALLGHSMASDIVVRYARTHPDVEATVGVSLFAPNGSVGSPRNLLIIDGALEPSFLHEQAYRIVGAAAGGQAREGVTYGSIADGTARRLALADGVEHIGVLYSGESMAEALDWFNQTFRRPGTGFLDTRGPWLGVLYLGLILLAWPLSGLLPRVAPARLGAGLRWRELLPVAIAPALLTPIVLWRLPSDFLPILLGDYLVLHFAFYGLLTMVGMVLVRRVRGRRPTAASARGSGWKLTVAALAVAAYGVLALGLPADLFVTSLAPGPGRVPLILAMLGGTLLYFVADEWLTRGENAPRGAYAVTKVCFLISLVLAIVLNLYKLFFLIIIVPAILAFFIVYGLFSGWAYHRTYHPMVGALANAIAFAWAIAVTFPAVSR